MADLCAEIVTAMCVILWGITASAGQSALPTVGIEEVRHDMVVRRRDATIEAVVHRSFRAVGATDLQLDTRIHLPMAAAITSFRLKTGSRWVPGRLLEKGVAARRYAAQIVRGHVTAPLAVSQRSYAPGKLQFWGSGQARLTVPRIRDDRETEIEYRLVLPSCYRGGSHYVVVPNDPEAQIGRFAHRRPTVWFEGLGASRVRGALKPQPLPESRSGLPQSGCDMPVGGPPSAYRLPKAPPTSVSARWASRPASPTQRIGRLEFEVPAILRPPAQRPLVVFVFDASLSHGDVGLNRQIALALLLASQYDRGEFQVVAFNRSARVLLPSFVPAASLPTYLKGLAWASRSIGNGSDLATALHEVARVLDVAKGASHREQRVVVFTDGAMAQRFRTDTALTALGPAPGKRLLHVVYDQGGSVGPLWEHLSGPKLLDPIARATGGTAMTIFGGTAATHRNRELLAHLVSPQRIDDFRIVAPVAFHRAPPHHRRALRLGEPRAAGAGFGETGLWSVDPRVPFQEPSVSLSGRIWGKPWRLEVRSSAHFRRQLGPLAVGDGTADELAKPDRLKWALAARVMSQATMFFAPSESLVPVEGGGQPGEVHYSRFPGTIGDATQVAHPKMTQAWHHRMSVRLRHDFRDHMRKCAAGRSWADATVALETTGVEVVAVDALAPDATTSRCAEEWAWALRLGSSFKFDTRFFIKGT